MIHQLFLGNLRLLLVRNGIQEQLGTHGILSGAACILFELLARHVLSSQHGLEDLLVATELLDDLLDLRVDLLLDNTLRQLKLGLLQSLGQNLVADLAGLGVLQLLLDLTLHRLLQLVQGIELASQLCEVVVQLRQLALLDGTELDGNLSLFVGVLAGNQLGGKGGLLALLHADQRVIQALDQGIVADLVGQALGGGLVDSLAVDGGGQVDGDEVALLHCAVSRLQGAKASLQVLQLCVDSLVVSLQRRNLNGDGGEVRNLDLRADVNLGGEGDVLAVLQLGDLDLRLPQGLHVVLLDSLAVARRQHLVDDLIQDNATAQASLQNLRRNLALAEARHVYLLREGCVGLVELWLKLLEWNLNRQLGAGGAQLFYRALHECTLLCINSFFGTAVSRSSRSAFTVGAQFYRTIARRITLGCLFRAPLPRNGSPNPPQIQTVNPHFTFSMRRTAGWRHKEKE